MTTIQIRECDLDSCDVRKEVKTRWSFDYEKPDGWVSAEGKHFCGYPHLIAWAQQQIDAQSVKDHDSP